MNSEPAVSDSLAKKDKLWTMNFFLLWQGQLVSALGNVVYGIALGFWVLAETGSTALMGTLMAASTLPGIILSPFAGVVVDRTNRKRLLVWMDLIRGIAIVLVGFAAYQGTLEVWMVFAAGILLGICGAFFNPAVDSAVPDTVSKSNVVKANSFFQMIDAGSGVVGNSLGGFIFQLFGAPFLFLFNGISYLFSAGTELFVKIPLIERKGVQPHFMEDMNQGFRFVWRFRGLRYIIASAGLFNFFAHMGIILLLPMFQRDPSLGAGRYGITMAVLMGGMLLGMVFTSAIDVPGRKRVMAFWVAVIGLSLAFAIFPLISYFPLMLLLVLVAGFANSVINVFLMATTQLAVPAENRGKVFGLMGTISQGLTPVAMALGGILAEFIPVKILISACFTANLIFFTPIGLLPAVQRFIGFDPERDTTQDIM